MDMNKKVAIKGNSINGIKIIQYLESLGGAKSNYLGNNEGDYYFLRENNDIDFTYLTENLKGYTLLEKIPVEKIYEVW